ncbi:acyltransferase family protein [Catellatospora sp. KI3]|uniref:acyltransferase family protein n=1 Tax=Catellatospora sp. KI3 TaxID=3041620 RepID=UPI002482C100|nr:acyltransferase family protein [Catellatospora sp. KI3]MDI1461319.1 acyltransferase family protein [Catellatospora sp. KI3]
MTRSDRTPALPDHRTAIECPPSPVEPDRAVPLPRQPDGGDRPRAGHRTLAFRADIEGIRAIAVLLVVLSHTGLSALAGGYVGVDVFFVISGFLITSLLFAELTATGTLSVARFYARRMTRLLPASTVVVLATLAGAWLWLPPARFAEYVGDALASTVYAVNIRLAVIGTDYLHATADPSPFQHFWSLAVEEQFYVVWPLTLLLLAWYRRRRRLPHLGASAAVVIAVLAAVSFALSVSETQRSATWAYFGAHTRVWELAAGALLAFAAARLSRLPAGVATLLTWVGLAAVVSAALLFDNATPFPGYAALLPVGGTVLLIAGGCAAPRLGARLLLDRAPMQWLGKLSYGWYLWHWPILMIAPTALGREPSVPLMLALSLVGLAAAAASYALVEKPVRRRRSLHSRPVRGIALGLSLSAVTAVAAFGISFTPPVVKVGEDAVDLASSLTGVSDQEAELARLLADSTAYQLIPANLTPSVTKAVDDRPRSYDDGCHLVFTAVTAPGACAYGDPGGDRTVVLFGDSHAAQWLPALERIAGERGWRLLSRTKSGCSAASVLPDSKTYKRAYHECSTWRESTLDEIGRLRPALVVTSSSDGDGAGLAGAPTDVEAVWTEGWQTTLRRLVIPGTRLAFISDTSWPKGNAPACLSTNAEQVTRCVRPVGEALLNRPRRERAAAAAAAVGATVIDPTAWLCTDLCPPIVGDTLVYLDDSHLTATYSRLLAPLLERRLPRL